MPVSGMSLWHDHSKHGWSLTRVCHIHGTAHLCDTQVSACGVRGWLTLVDVLGPGHLPGPVAVDCKWTAVTHQSQPSLSCGPFPPRALPVFCSHLFHGVNMLCDIDGSSGWPWCYEERLARSSLCKPVQVTSKSNCNCNLKCKILEPHAQGPW